MKILLICVLFVAFNAAKAALHSNCEIEGVNNTLWSYGWELEAINDTAEGIIASFKTHNITGVTVKAPGYIDPIYKNGVLQLHTTEEFKNNYESNVKPYAYEHQRVIELTLNFKCTVNTEDLRMSIPVIDTNNHLPIFTQDKYEYKFGMNLPSGLDITGLQRIRASDVDFTNDKISFSFISASGSDVEESEYFSFQTTGEKISPDRDSFYTAIVTKKEITHSIREEYTIVATDEGKPEVSKSTAKLIIDVDMEGFDSPAITTDIPITTGGPKQIHPPVFSKSLYFANYTRDHKFPMREPISLLFGEPNLMLHQFNLTEYFDIYYDHTRKEVDVLIKVPLPMKEFEKRYLMILIEAINPGLNIPGKTTVVINLLEEKIVAQDVCTMSRNYVLPMIIFFSMILVILVVNVCAVSLYLRNQKLTIAVSTPPSTSPRQLFQNKDFDIPIKW